MGVIWIYIKNIGVFLFVSGALLLLSSQLASLGNNLWLAAWSGDGAANANLTARLNELANTPGGKDTVEYKDGIQKLNTLRDTRLGVYGAIGFLQGISWPAAVSSCIPGASVVSLFKNQLSN